MGTPAPPPGAKAGLPGVSQAALPRLQASQSREVPGEPGPLKWSPRQAHGAPHLCLKGRRQPLGVVGLWGWWERAEEVRGPSPTLARRRETGGSRPDGSPAAPRLCTLTSHCAPEGALTSGCFLSTHCVQAEGFEPAGASPRAWTLRLAPAGPPPAPCVSPAPPTLRLPEVRPRCAQVGKLETPLVSLLQEA